LASKAGLDGLGKPGIDVALLAPALVGIPVHEDGAMAVQQAVVGTGAADKEQGKVMVRRLLPGATLRRADAADALAVAICHAHHRATRLRVEELFPVCSPKFMRGRGALRSPADLKRHTLLHVNDRRDWSQWLGAADVKTTDVERGPIFNQAHMAIDAAVDGQGIALARTALAAWDLCAGRLVRPFRFALKAPYAYWIVCPKPTAELPKISIFREWLLAEAAEDAQRMRKDRSNRLSAI